MIIKYRLWMMKFSDC